jgi:4-amino-4-deoxy-L-arabinose transferase-like glycosyltransferase
MTHNMTPTTGISRFLLHTQALLIVLLLLSAIPLFYRVGSHGLFDVDEAVFAEATREMVESGDWLTPHYNGNNRYDKPILFYWVMALSYFLFGVNEFAARFPSALASLLLVLTTFFFARSFFNVRAAFWGAMALAGSLQIAVLSHAAITDMLLTLFIAGSLYSFLLGYKADPALKGWYLSSAVCMGLATLTKGPVGVVLPGLIILLFLLLRGEFKRSIRSIPWLPMFLIFSINYGIKYL